MRNHSLTRTSAHYLIEGMPLYSAACAWNIARERGFTGSKGALQKRLNAGVSTWAELIAEPANSATKSAAAKARGVRSRAAGVEAAAAVDARKKAMREAGMT